MPNITMTRCAGGNHVTIEVRDDKGNVIEKFSRDWSEFDREAVKQPETIEEAQEKIVSFVKAQAELADAKTFEEIKQAAEGKEVATTISSEVLSK